MTAQYKVERASYSRHCVEAVSTAGIGLTLNDLRELVALARGMDGNTSVEGSLDGPFLMYSLRVSETQKL